MAAAPPLSLAFSSIHLTKPSICSALSSFRLLPTRFSSTELSITFGSRKPKLPQPLEVPAASSAPTLSAAPPSEFFQSIAEKKATSGKKANPKPKPKPNEKLVKKAANATATQQKYSKAARRYYNQTFREPQRLAKVLAESGVASRRKSEELIFDGKVTVNGSVCKLPQTKVDLLRDSIYVKGNRLPKKLSPRLYFAVNKPKGYICSNGQEPKSVISLFDDYWKTWNKMNPGLPKPRLFTVGRLDVGTMGLIIVTNDGNFAQQIAHPSSSITREYIATIEGVVHRRHLIAISDGVEVEGVRCVPDLVELLPSQPEVSRSRLRIVVHEGRNHEVRELVKNAGLQVYTLKRVRIGEYRLLPDLGIGKYAELKPSDLKLLGAKPSDDA